jgi:acyl-CoA thioesterase-1
MVSSASPVVTCLPSPDALMMLCARLFNIARFLTVALALALPAAASAATILVYGDSLSAGYGLPREQGWVSLLEQRLREEKLDYRVVNASISGETTSGGRSRINGALKTHRPALVIVELGGNDGLRGTSLDATRANLEAIVDASLSSKAAVLLVGIRLPPNFGMDYTSKFQQVFSDVARSRRLRPVPFLLDGFGEKREFFQPDGIHPTAEAQPLMLDAVWKELKPLLKRQ